MLPHSFIHSFFVFLVISPSPCFGCLIVFLFVFSVLFFDFALVIAVMLSFFLLYLFFILFITLLTFEFEHFLIVVSVVLLIFN